eukprot:2434411-Amphidinium_carterae.1
MRSILSRVTIDVHPNLFEAVSAPHHGRSYTHICMAHVPPHCPSAGAQFQSTLQVGMLSETPHICWSILWKTIAAKRQIVACHHTWIFWDPPTTADQDPNDALSLRLLIQKRCSFGTSYQFYPATRRFLERVVLLTMANA